MKSKDALRNFLFLLRLFFSITLLQGSAIHAIEKNNRSPYWLGRYWYERALAQDATQELAKPTIRAAEFGFEQILVETKRKFEIEESIKNFTQDHDVRALDYEYRFAESLAHLAASKKSGRRSMLQSVEDLCAFAEINPNERSAQLACGEITHLVGFDMWMAEILNANEYRLVDERGQKAWKRLAQSNKATKSEKFHADFHIGSFLGDQEDLARKLAETENPPAHVICWLAARIPESERTQIFVTLSARSSANDFVLPLLLTGLGGMNRIRENPTPQIWKLLSNAIEKVPLERYLKARLFPARRYRNDDVKLMTMEY